MDAHAGALHEMQRASEQFDESRTAAAAALFAV
jgi:hypothetical protein